MATRPMTPAYRLTARGVLIPFLKAVTRQHVTGTQHIPRDQGFIAVANHLSDLDSLTVMRALVDEDVPVYALIKSTLYDAPVLGHVFKAGGQIPVYRGTERAGNALVEAERRLALGDAILIFPEGTLSRDPLRWPMTGKTGTARLAMRTGVPVLPIGQWGAHEVLDTYAKRFRPFPRKDVEIRIGEPLDLSRFGSDDQDKEAVRACTAEIMRAITSLVEEIRGQKAPRPYDMRYDGDPGNGRMGVRRPDPATGEAAPGTAPSAGRADGEPPAGDDAADHEPGRPA